MEDKNNRLNRILSWSPSPLLLGAEAVIALLLLLAPLIRLALYAVPWYDDFNYGGFAKRMMVEEPGIMGALKGAWECARVQWYAWQGTFSSIFFMALVPFIWGEKYYCIGSIFLILLLTVSVFTLTGTLAKKVLHVDFASSLCLQAVTSILVIELVYTTPSAYFWYNPGIHYIGMHSFAMLFLVVLIWLFTAERMKSAGSLLLLTAGMAGALLTGGSNFVTTLQGLVLLGSLGIFTYFTDRKKLLRYLPIAAVYAFAFYKNVSAPGNQVRGAFYEGWGYSPVRAVFRSFVEAFLHLGKFTGWTDHVRRLEEAFSRLGAEDVTVLCGDTSWGMDLRESLEDFRFIDRLPGKKLLMKGNHDYWWTTRKKMEAFFESRGLTTLEILHNNSVEVEGVSLCGSRGWLFEGNQKYDPLIVAREEGRIRRSLASAPEEGEKILFLHYPPAYGSQELPEFFAAMADYGVRECWYAHIHGAGAAGIIQGERRGVRLGLLSADYLDFTPRCIRSFTVCI